MKRGSYIGGSTVIGPNSGWFSKPKSKKELAAAKLAARQQAQADAELAARRKELKRQKHDERMRAEAAVRDTPEYQAQRAREKAEKRKLSRARKAAAAEARKVREDALANVQVFRKEGSKLTLVRRGLMGRPAPGKRERDR